MTPRGHTRCYGMRHSILFSSNRSGIHDGAISNPGTIQDAVTRMLRQQLQQQQDQCIGGPGFDSIPAYGLFPAAGFGYFFGFNGTLTEPAPEKGGPGKAR